MIDFVFFPKSGRIQQSILLTCAMKLHDMCRSFRADPCVYLIILTPSKAELRLSLARDKYTDDARTSCCTRTTPLFELDT